MRWSELTWSEIPAALAAVNHAAILPVGATEQHGPHLGCGVDFVIAEELCLAVSEKTRVPVLPTLPYGSSLGHSKRWPGTISLQPITLIEVVKQIGDWAYHSGVRRLFIVNAHVTNVAPLRCALEMLRAEHDDMMVASIGSATLSDRVRKFHFADAADWHANDAETSLMLAIAPALVRPELCAEADDMDRTGGCIFPHPVNRTSLNGVTGKPSQASADKGRSGFDWMVEDLSALIAKGLTEKPPLDFEYNSHYDDAA
ncbi:creatininase family protein [Sideroxydans lithotrophicus]|uniref:Creatininase n=1 Tax=Sideroxydans lithotrophicus (strain ES-1) TaxID=580332 RepID=D5CTM9_SIDLE|nr:creatininase family protein [Sideroxydans lithotrophicus]ADE10335.1 Creatininase [Sideroxydans lithotrophicus ES-1]